MWVNGSKHKKQYSVINQQNAAVTMRFHRLLSLHPRHCHWQYRMHKLHTQWCWWLSSVCSGSNFQATSAFYTTTNRMQPTARSHINSYYSTFTVNSWHNDNPVTFFAMAKDLLSGVVISPGFPPSSWGKHHKIDLMIRQIDFDCHCRQWHMDSWYNDDGRQPQPMNQTAGDSHEEI